MYARIVTFRIEGPSHDDYVAHASAVADGFNEWEGLLAKFWLSDEDAGRYGGIYLFTDEAAADASRATPLFDALDAPTFADLRIEEFAILDAPTAITHGLRASVVRGAA